MIFLFFKVLVLGIRVFHQISLFYLCLKFFKNLKKQIKLKLKFFKKHEKLKGLYITKPILGQKLIPLITGIW